MNYSGLRKRDTYDEIVRMLETDTTKGIPAAWRARS